MPPSARYQQRRTLLIDVHEVARICRKFTDVDQQLLVDAIECVYALWDTDQRRLRRSQIDFHQYFLQSILILGLTGSLVERSYRRAIAAYFRPRAERARKRREGVPPAPEHGVEEANSKEVLIRVTPDVSVRFRAMLDTGKLKWMHVQPYRKKEYIRNAFIPPADLHHARKQALAILNEKRGYASRSRKRKQ